MVLASTVRQWISIRNPLAWIAFPDAPLVSEVRFRYTLRQTYSRVCYFRSISYFFTSRHCSNEPKLHRNLPEVPLPVSLSSFTCKRSRPALGCGTKASTQRCCLKLVSTASSRISWRKEPFNDLLSPLRSATRAVEQHESAVCHSDFTDALPKFGQMA